MLKLAMGLDISADYLLTGRVTDLELDQLLSSGCGSCPGRSTRHMLTVIKEYLWALGRR